MLCYKKKSSTSFEGDLRIKGNSYSALVKFFSESAGKPSMLLIDNPETLTELAPVKIFLTLEKSC